MAHGSKVFLEVPEPAAADSDQSSADVELANMQHSKPFAALGVRNNISSTSSVQELLECPVCGHSMYPPIHQCPNGHMLCSNCKVSIRNHCPTCHLELGNIRCLALEKVAEFLEPPCIYQSLGCPENFPYSSKLKHKQPCKFRPYNCPYAGSECHVTGDIPYLVAHLRDDHKLDMHDGCTFNHHYIKSNPCEVENATWMLTAFLLGTTPVYMAFLRFMAEDEEAKSFSYSLEVGGNGQKLMLQGVPSSIRDNHKKVRDDKEDLKLPVTGRIWKDQ